MAGDMTLGADPDVCATRQIPYEHLSMKRPQFVYRARQDCPVWTDETCRTRCQLTTNVNESQLWCPECGELGEWTPLHKSFQGQEVAYGRVWHDPGVPHPATGQPVSGMRDLREQLRRSGGEMEERLGMAVNYEPVDLTERDALGITDEGMDSTHDVAVREGRKESKGKFVW